MDNRNRGHVERSRAKIAGFGPSEWSSRLVFAAITRRHFRAGVPVSGESGSRSGAAWTLRSSRRDLAERIDLGAEGRNWRAGAHAERSATTWKSRRRGGCQRSASGEVIGQIAGENRRYSQMTRAGRALDGYRASIEMPCPSISGTHEQAVAADESCRRTPLVTARALTRVWSTTQHRRHRRVKRKRQTHSGDHGAHKRNSFQTNLSRSNAAVEAARAGEGAGICRVGGEVRNLRGRREAPGQKRNRGGIASPAMHRKRRRSVHERSREAPSTHPRRDLARFNAWVANRLGRDTTQNAPSRSINTALVGGQGTQNNRPVEETRPSAPRCPPGSARCGSLRQVHREPARALNVPRRKSSIRF
jgi:hypothetical protein